MEVPTSVDRTAGDIHVDGNPHIHTDPLNGIIIARNILKGLQRVAPAESAQWAAREQDFERRVLEATMGRELVQILTPATAYSLLESGKLDDFIGRQQYQGKPLAGRLGGWLAQARVLRGKEIACYHKEWAYFSRRFGVSCITYIEAKPGIPPTPGHVQEVIALMRERKIPVLFASNYFDRRQIQQVAERTGAKAVIVSENAGGMPGTDSYFDLVGSWIAGLTSAFEASTPRAGA
jgi:ABC-type Zn uptake system ZnuABC Zn-binding protein ZnuA